MFKICKRSRCIIFLRCVQLLIIAAAMMGCQSIYVQNKFDADLVSESSLAFSSTLDSEDVLDEDAIENLGDDESSTEVNVSSVEDEAIESIPPYAVDYQIYAKIKTLDGVALQVDDPSIQIFDADGTELLSLSLSYDDSEGRYENIESISLNSSTSYELVFTYAYDGTSLESTKSISTTDDASQSNTINVYLTNTDSSSKSTESQCTTAMSVAATFDYQLNAMNSVVLTAEVSDLTSGDAVVIDDYASISIETYVDGIYVSTDQIFGLETEFELVEDGLEYLHIFNLTHADSCFDFTFETDESLSYRPSTTVSDGQSELEYYLATEIISSTTDDNVGTVQFQVSPLDYLDQDIDANLFSYDVGVSGQYVDTDGESGDLESLINSGAAVLAVTASDSKVNLMTAEITVETNIAEIMADIEVTASPVVSGSSLSTEFSAELAFSFDTVKFNILCNDEGGSSILNQSIDISYFIAGNGMTNIEAQTSGRYSGKISLTLTVIELLEIWAASGDYFFMFWDMQSRSPAMYSTQLKDILEENELITNLDYEGFINNNRNETLLLRQATFSQRY